MLPKNDRDYQKLQLWLDQLLDVVGEDEDHPLMGLIDAMGHLIAIYKEMHFKEMPATGVDALKYLMEAHQLS